MDALARLAGVYSLQILLLVGVATAASFVRVPPSARLVFWRIVVAACLLLPLAPPRIVELDRALSITATIAQGVTVIPRSLTPVPWAAIIGWVLVAGAALRGLWIVVGLVRLRTLTDCSEIADLDDDLLALKRMLAPHAAIRWHDTVRQPVTFGARHATVLLPSQLRGASPDVRRAVVCHELVHVHRGDWSAMIAEEVVQAVFWFHPAMWWAIEQIRLNREATVDARVVDITGSRRTYMEALLTFADSRTLALAPLFARRRQIVIRIKELSEEVVMSRIRTVCALTAIAGIVAGAGWTVVSALPMRTTVRYRPAAVRQSAADIMLRTVHAAAAAPVAHQRVSGPPPPPPPPPPPNAPRPIEKVNPDYPEEALPYGPVARVTVRLTIDLGGNVTDAKGVDWRLTIDKEISDPNYWASKPQRPFVDAAEQAALRWRFAPLEKDTLRSIDIVFNFRNEPDKAPDLMALRSKMTPATTIDEPGRKVVRVGGGVMMPRKIRDVRPEFPAEAKAAGMQGVVVIEVRIGTDGSVLDAKILQSVPVFDNAALTAVRQWKFEPPLLNGAPVDVVTTVTVNFALQ
jgi:TonB family protein